MDMHKIDKNMAIKKPGKDLYWHNADKILYCNAFLNKSSFDSYRSANDLQYSIYEKLRGEGMAHLHYIKDDALIGTDGEATVDGCHFTDLGYMRFSEKLIGPLKKIIGFHDL